MLVLIYDALLTAKEQNKGKTVYYVNSNAGASKTTRLILWSTDSEARAYVINEAYANHTEICRVSYLAGQKFYLTEDKLGNLNSTYLTPTQELIIKTILNLLYH